MGTVFFQWARFTFTGQSVTPVVVNCAETQSIQDLRPTHLWRNNQTKLEKKCVVIKLVRCENVLDTVIYITPRNVVKYHIPFIYINDD